jgi:hypothetical protein
MFRALGRIARGGIGGISVARQGIAFRSQRIAEDYKQSAGKDSMEDQQKPSNEVSDETGQFDPRFLLWRKFCDEHGVAVNSLPSDLSGETKNQWEKQKRDADNLTPIR